MIAWVQAGSNFEEFVEDDERDSVEFDITISLKINKSNRARARSGEEYVPLSRYLNAVESALIESVDDNPDITLSAAEPDESTINAIRYIRSFTLTVQGAVAYDGVLSEEESDALFGTDE